MFDFLNNAFGTAAYRDPTVTDLPEEVQQQLARRAQMQAGLAMMDAASGRRGQPMAGLGSVVLAGQRQGQEVFGQGVERAREGQSRAEGKAFADEINGLQDPEAKYQKAMFYAQKALGRGDFKRYEQFLQFGEQASNMARQQQLRGILSGGGQVMPSQARVGTPNAVTPNLTGVPMAQPNAESPLPLGGVIQGTVPQQRNPQAQRMREAAQFSLQNGQIDEAKKFFDMAETLDPRPKAPEAFSLSPGQTRFGPDGRPMASMPTEDPSEVREYNFARQQGYKGSFEDWTIRKRQAGASQTNVSISPTEKSLAGEVGPIFRDGMDKASGALNQWKSADALVKAVDSGKVITGTLAGARLDLARLSDTLGVAGADSKERLANTQAAVQNLAKLTLAGRQQMKGQGAITESESKLAERAMSGDINFTPTELRTLAAAAKRAAAFEHQKFKTLIGKARARGDTAGLADFFDVEDLPQESAPSNDGWSAKRK